ncbi:hypothetical protein AVEN_247440-1, partial [Araneus ventricosus]
MLERKESETVKEDMEKDEEKESETVKEDMERVRSSHQSILRWCLCNKDTGYR